MVAWNRVLAVRVVISVTVQVFFEGKATKNYKVLM